MPKHHMLRRLMNPLRTATRRVPVRRQAVGPLDALEDRTVPTDFPVVPVNPANASAMDNDYIRINNAVQAAANDTNPGADRVVLTGTFLWNEPFALASWANGSDGTFDGVGTYLDDNSILIPVGKNDVTITAPNANGGANGGATIQGPGDLTAADVESVFYFKGTGLNTGWTISNLHLLDFDAPIYMSNDTTPLAPYQGTTITNNTIRVATDAAESDDHFNPAANTNNVGILMGPGINQTVSNNLILIPGNGATPASQGGVGIQNVSISDGMGGFVTNLYDGLQITGNTIRVLNAQDATNPERVIGIWDDSHSHTSNITVSGNTFENKSAANAPAVNQQTAFLVTSHSSNTTAVAYSNNTVTGANIGFEWVAGQTDFAGNKAVRIAGNTLTNNNTGVLVQSFGLANLFQNTIAGGDDGVRVQTSGTLVPAGAVTRAVEQNSITGAANGINITASAGAIGAVFNNNLSGNTAAAVVNDPAAAVDASANAFGSTDPAVVSAKIAGANAAQVDFTPFLNATADTAPGTPGFQGNFGDLTVHTLGAQTGGRLAEAAGVLTAPRNLTVRGNPTLADAFTLARNGANADLTWTKNAVTEGPVSFTGVGTLTLVGNDGDDTFTIAPPTSAAVANLVIAGGPQTAADALSIDFTGVVNPTLFRGSSGSASGTGVTSLTWTGIETETYTNAPPPPPTGGGGGGGDVSPPPADTVKPTPPTNLRASNINVTSFTLAWNPSTDNVGVTSYFVIVRDPNGFVKSVPAAVGATPSVVIDGLVTDRPYTVSVQAFDAAGNGSDPSAPLAVTPRDTEKPSTPRNLRASNVVPGSFSLAWDASTDNVGVAGYGIVVAGPGGARVINAPPAATPSAVIDGLAPGTYTVTVQAFDAAGNSSDVSAPLTVVTGASPPAAPSALAAIPTGAGVLLSWADNSGDETGFEVEVTGPSGTPTVTPVAANVNNLLVAGTAGQAFSARVRAVNAAGKSAFSNTAAATVSDLQSPTVPLNLRLAGTPTGTPATGNLAWDASRDNVGVTQYIVTPSAGAPITVPGTVTTVSVPGLLPGSTTTFTMIAVDAAGNRSAASDALAVTIPPATADTEKPTVPGNLRASNVTATAFTVTWDASRDNVAVTGYTVAVTGPAGFSQTVTAPGGTPSAAITGLTAGTTYTVTVRAADAAGNTSDATAPLAATTTAAAVAFPVYAASQGGGVVVAKRADTNATLRTFRPFGTDYTGALNVALGDVNKDGFDDIIVAADETMKGRVKIYSGKAAATAAGSVDFTTSTDPTVLLRTFDPFEDGFVASRNGYEAGVTVAAGDVDGDGFVDVVCGTVPGAGNVGRFTVVSGKGLLEAGKLPARIGNVAEPFGPEYVNGVQVAVGKVLAGDGGTQVIAGTTANRSIVKTFGLRAANGPDIFFVQLGPVVTAFPSPTGVRVAAFNADGTGAPEIAVAQPAGGTVRVYAPTGTGAVTLDKAADFYTRAGVSGLSLGVQGTSLAVAASGTAAAPAGATQVDLVGPVAALGTKGTRAGGFNAFDTLTGALAIGFGTAGATV